MSQTTEGRVRLYKLVIVGCLVGAVVATVAVKGSEGFGFFMPPWVLPFIWASDALGICFALWQIKLLKTI
jgi:hypothetical protein